MWLPEQNGCTGLSTLTVHEESQTPVFSLTLGISQLSNFCQYIEFQEGARCCFNLRFSNSR